MQQACQHMNFDSEKRRAQVNLAGGKLKLCALEKTASTFVKTLSAREHFANNQKATPEVPHQTQPPEPEVKRLVIVRDPYTRLLSAYFDKLYTRPTWYKFASYGRYIIEHFRFNATKEKIDCASDVSWPEFVRFMINSMETDRMRNPHFDPMYKRCEFCVVDYDYYVHLETIGSDMEHIYQTINTTMVSAMSDEQDAIRSKCGEIVAHREDAGNCQTVEEIFHRAWFSFKARGFIASDVNIPLTKEEMKNVTKNRFSDLCWQAHLDSVARIDKKRQRREKVVEMYLQLPLLDRLKLREIFLKDFQLHGYDSTPSDLFPELR